MKKTILVGEFKHETNSFMPEKSGVEAFMARDYFFGEEIFKVFQGVRNELGGIPVSYTHLDVYKRQILDSGIVEQMMFSINPAYDYQHGEYAAGSAGERMDLYRRCEAEGVGISVMKPYSGGQLLDDRTSPFGRALTKIQCLQYALDKPGVLTVLPGVRNLDEMKEALSWLEAAPKERDYSVLGTFTPKDVTGTCVYCNHCAPCPAGLNIGLINKYYDLARIGDDMAADHYAKLEKHASDCLHCGHCDRRCPFGVAQSRRMEEIREYFGEA